MCVRIGAGSIRRLQQPVRKVVMAVWFSGSDCSYGEGGRGGSCVYQPGHECWLVNKANTSRLQNCDRRNHVIYTRY